MSFFNNQLKDFISQINCSTSLDEWYLSDFIEKYVNSMNSEEAFSSISYVCSAFVEYNSIGSDVIYEILVILDSLLRVANTKEKPQELLLIEVTLNEITKDNHFAYVHPIIQSLLSSMGAKGVNSDQRGQHVTRMGSSP